MKRVLFNLEQMPAPGFEDTELGVFMHVGSDGRRVCVFAQTTAGKCAKLISAMDLRRLPMLPLSPKAQSMTAVNDSDDAPTAEEIRSALERIVTGPSFRRSPQLVAFLRFLVDSVLCGRAEHIKSYTIGVEALKRGQRFDPQADPIVRVEAARLRKALASTFAGEGAGLPVTIEIPLGSYVPVFRRRKNRRSIVNLITILMQTLRSTRTQSYAHHFRLPFFALLRPMRKRATGAGLGGSSTG